MANTTIEAIYTAMKTEYEPEIFVRYPYVFDEPGIPYIYMYEVDDPRLKGFLCDDKGGETRITFGYMSTSFTDCVDQLETVIDFVTNLYGTYTPLEIWKVQVQSVRDLTGLEQGQPKIYRREFDAVFSWSN